MHVYLTCDAYLILTGLQPGAKGDQFRNRFNGLFEAWRILIL